MGDMVADSEKVVCVVEWEEAVTGGGVARGGVSMSIAS